MVNERCRCTVDGCPNEARPDRKECQAHRLRRYRGKPVDEPIRHYGLSPRELLSLASTRRENVPAEDSDEFRRADDLHKKYAVMYALAGKKRRVSRRKCSQHA